MAPAAPLERYFGHPERVREALGRRSEPLERAFDDGTAEEIIVRNRTLMNLRAASPVWEHLDAATKRGRWDRAAFEAWLDEQRLGSVDRAQLIAQLERIAASD